MSWDYIFCIEFSKELERPFALRYLAEAFSKHYDLTLLRAYQDTSDKYEQTKKKKLIPRKEGYEEIRLDQVDIDRETKLAILGDFVNRNAKECYQIETYWRVKRYLSVPSLISRSVGIKVRTEYDEEIYVDHDGVELTIYSSDFPVFHHLSKNEFFNTGIYYNVGSTKKYNGCRVLKSLASDNIAETLKELTILAHAGAKSIFGLDAEPTPDPRKWSLVYHCDVQDFLVDIQRLQMLETTDMTLFEIIEVIDELTSIEYQLVDKGMIVYNKLGAGGNLSSFYQALANRLK